MNKPKIRKLMEVDASEYPFTPRHELHWPGAGNVRTDKPERKK